MLQSAYDNLQKATSDAVTYKRDVEYYTKKREKKKSHNR